MYNVTEVPRADEMASMAPVTNALIDAVSISQLAKFDLT
jgi:hypothetical protein